MPHWHGARLKNRRDIRFLEILSLEQKRLGSSFGKGIGKTVTEIQPSRVAPLAEIEKGLTGKVCVVDRDGLNEDPCATKKVVALAPRVGPNLPLNHNGQFHKISGADPAAVCVMNELGVEYPLGLAEEDRGQRGGVQNHFGSPRSS